MGRRRSVYLYRRFILVTENPLNTITLEHAQGLASQYLENLQRQLDTPLQIVERQDLPFGWLFFYDSQAYVESGDLGLMLVGNAPFLIDGADGSLHELGTAQPVETSLQAYERARRK